MYLGGDVVETGDCKFEIIAWKTTHLIFLSIYILKNEILETINCKFGIIA